MTGEDALALFAPGGDGALRFSAGAEDETDEDVEAYRRELMSMRKRRERREDLQPRAKRKKAETRAKSSTW